MLMTWSSPNKINDFKDVKASLIIDSHNISQMVSQSWVMQDFDGVVGWGARIEAFDSRCYPIIFDNEKELSKRKHIIKRVNRALISNDKRSIQRAYNSWFRFLNMVLLKLDAYPATPTTYIGKKPEVKL